MLHCVLNMCFLFESTYNAHISLLMDSKNTKYHGIATVLALFEVPWSGMYKLWFIYKVIIHNLSIFQISMVLIIDTSLYHFYTYSFFYYYYY